MTMWVHYSNNNIGFCVSYDMKVNIGLSNCTFPVQCTDIRLDVTNLLRVQTQKTSDAIDCQTISGNKEIILDDFTIVFISCLLCNLKHLISAPEEKLKQAKYVADVRARTIKNAGIAAVCEYLLG